jgi:hypothetical protein
MATVVHLDLENGAFFIAPTGPDIGVEEIR